jgi:hypothetical protein
VTSILGIVADMVRRLIALVVFLILAGLVLAIVVGACGLAILVSGGGH